MVKSIFNLLTILLTMLSAKLVQSYTAVIGFALILISIVFPSKKYNQKSISVDHDELENLQRQISSTFTKVQQCDTFPVSIDSSFSSHVALDVIESQNQRYQDYIKFKVQMKKKQNKQSSSNKSPILNSAHIIENSFVKGQNAYLNDLNIDNLSCFNGYNQECSEAQKLDIGSLDSCFDNQIQDQDYCDKSDINNSCCCKENASESIICSDENQDIECNKEQNNQQTHQRNPSKNSTSYNLNKNINKQSVEVEEQLNEEEDISTEDSSSSNTSDEDESCQQELNDFHEQLDQFDVKSSFNSHDLNKKQSSDSNIELLNQQVFKNQLHNYFNLTFLQIKKIRFDSAINIQDQFENYCSRKRCPCLKFKRRFQRVRSVQANKKKLPTILENFAY